jgi:hypothetical protein
MFLTEIVLAVLIFLTRTELALAVLIVLTDFFLNCTDVPY